jgi:O-succinylbenzoic acid--CoA ligase
MTGQLIPNWLYKRAHLTPNRIAVIFNGEALTFSELDDRAVQMGQKLYQAGIQKGESVAFLLKNNVQTVVFIHAIQYIGAVIVPLNTRLTSSELFWQINDSDAKLVIVDETFHGQTEHFISQNIHTLSIDELTRMSGADFKLQTEINLDDLHTIMYTSGTTGKPKGVMLTSGNHWWSAIGSSLNLGLYMDDRWLACVPLFHVSGLSILMRSVIYGMTVVLHESFDPKTVNRSIHNEKVTIVSVVSAMLSRMLDELESEAYPAHLRCMLLGGGSAPKPILEKCKHFSIPVYQTYGMTETASQIVTLAPEDMLRKLGSAGKPLFPAQLKIVKDNVEQPVNESGEIVVCGPNVTRGYFNRNDATAEVLKGGWLYTGDIGYVDEEGFLYVLDRRSDLIISGGENVYPAEVEAILLSHPEVKDAGVTGSEHDKWGQVPVAFVVLKKPVSEADLKCFCEQHLARYKVPDSIYFINELLRNASNKLLRRELMSLIDGKK